MKKSIFLVYVFFVMVLSVSARILVQESFPSGSGAYPSSVIKLNKDATNYAGTGIDGFMSGWTDGSEGTGVFSYDPNGLAFPSGVLRTAAGSGTAFFSHGQGSATGADYGRILGRRIDSSVRGSLNTGVYYMSLLVQSASETSLSILAPGHWRMMGIAPNCNPVSTPDLMNNGVYLGIANINGTAVNALRVGPNFATISPHTAGSTYFLLARIDLVNLTVHAREVPITVSADVLSDYTATLPLSSDYAGSLLSFMNVGGDYALKETKTYFDEFLVSTTLAEQLGTDANSYVLDDIQVLHTTDSALSGSVPLLDTATDGTLIIDIYSIATGDLVQSVTLDNPTLGDNAFSVSGLNSGNQYSATARVEVNGAIVATSTSVLFRTAGITVLPEMVLVREGFPVGESAYKSSQNLYKYNTRILNPDVEGLFSGWAYGDTTTGVLHIDATGGLFFPESIPRTPSGDAALFFNHSQSTPTATDYGRLLGCATTGSVSSYDAAGVFYMSLLTATADEKALANIAEGHWRMMGLAQSSSSDNSSSLMSSGIFLGIAKINGEVVNALRVGFDLAPISPYVAGTTSFLLARIDFNARKVFAREVTAPFAPDAPESYTVSIDLPSTYASVPFQYLIAGGDYSLAGKRTYFDEFLLSTRLSHHIGIEPGSFTISDVSAYDITPSSASLSVHAASLGGEATLCLDVIDEVSATTNTLSAAAAIGANTFAITDLTPATHYLLRAYFLVDGEPAGSNYTSSFGTAGVPVLANLAAEAIKPTGSDASVLHLSVDLAEAGLAPTTIELLAGTSPDLLTAIGSSNPMSATGSFALNTSLFSIGSTIYFAARATCLYDGRTLVATTPVKSFFYTANDIWFNTTGNNDWYTPENWSQGVVPNLGISATINRNVGDLFTLADIAASNLVAECGNTSVTLDLNEKRFSTTRLSVGSGARGLFTLRNGRSAANELRIGGTGASKNSRLILDGGRIDVASVTRIGNPEGTHGGNSLIVTNGAAAALSSVRLGLPSNDASGPNGNHIILAPGASMSYTDLYMHPGGDNTISVDNAAVWGHGSIVITGRSGGNGTGTNIVTIANNSTWTAIQSDVNFEWFNGRLLVLNGSVISASNFRIGTQNDHGSGNEVVVSNSILTAAWDLALPADNRHGSNTFRLFDDPGIASNAVVEVAHNLYVGNNTARPGNAGNCNNLFQIRGGTLTVAAQLFVGGGCEEDTGNTLDVAGSNASITTRWLSMRNGGTLKFTLPKGGFSTPSVITASEDVNISTDSKLVVDTSNASPGIYTLISAPSFAGSLAPENITLIQSPGQNVKILVNPDDSGTLAVNVRPTATILYLR